MKFKGILIVVKDCKKALKFYQDMFGFELIRDHDGNMELSGNLYLQEEKYWERFIVEDLCPPLCHELWNSIYPSVYALQNGASLDYGDCCAIFAFVPY